MYICYVEESRPPLLSSGRSSWLQIRRPGFDCQRYQIIQEVVGLERGPLSLVSTAEELLERKSSGCGLENREYGRRDPSRCPHGTPYPQTLAITLPTSGGRSVGVVRSRTQAMEFSFFFAFCLHCTECVHKACGMLLCSCSEVLPFEIKNEDRISKQRCYEKTLRCRIRNIIVIDLLWLRHCSTSRKIAGSKPDEVSAFFFSINLILPAALGPGVHSAPNRNEYQKLKNDV
jgi:hypothetical protein